MPKIEKEILGVSEPEFKGVWSFFVVEKRDNKYLKKVYKFNNERNVNAAHAYICGQASKKIAPPLNPEITVLQLKDVKVR